MDKKIRALDFNSNDFSTLSNTVATANQFSSMLCFDYWILATLSPNVKGLNNYPQHFPLP